MLLGTWKSSFGTSLHVVAAFQACRSMAHHADREAGGFNNTRLALISTLQTDCVFPSQWLSQDISLVLHGISA